MAFLEKVLKKSDNIDIEEFLNNLDVDEESSLEDADAYVKPVFLEKEEDILAVIEEAKKGNIVLLNISGMAKRNAMKLREYVTTIKASVDEINGDIARISHDRVLITPSRVKIIKKRG